MERCFIRLCEKTPMWSDGNVVWCDDHKSSLADCEFFDVRFIGVSLTNKETNELG
jgi:hypothetical protein